MCNLNKLTPATFMLPTVIPCVVQRYIRFAFVFLSLADPLVRFGFFFYLPFCFCLRSSVFKSSNVLPRFSCALFGTCGSFLVSLFIMGIVAALARRGASPWSTPAGL